jgi:dihydropteroate synthase
MGVLNVTPDSFSDGGAFVDLNTAVQRGVQIASEGADLLDIGGESTRPGSQGVPLEEELRRVLPVVERLSKAVRIPISIDTSKAEVASLAIESGASLVNDVTALRADPKMATVVARSKAAVILMHMQGTPATMQKRPRYHDVVTDVAEFLLRAATQAQRAGIERSRILVDPGLGFGKTVAHNLELVRALERFVSLGFPVVVGPSRKSFIGKTLHAEVQDRLTGTLACVAYAQRCGVHVVRVHDVQPTVQLIRMLESIEQVKGCHDAPWR